MARHTEYASCVGVAEWWALTHRMFGIPEGLLIHIPMSSNNPRAAFHAKRMGARKGIPDYMLCVPNQTYHGLFIEMKSATGALRPEQKAMALTLGNQGYAVRMCRSAQEARNLIENYLNNKEI